MAFNIADIFEHAVDLMPDRLALVCGEQRRTYAELEARANRAAHALAAQGVQPGEHVGIYAQNCAEWIESMLGCFKLRAVPINVNFRYVEDELRYIFDNADLVGVVYDPQYAGRLQAIEGELPKLRFKLAIGDEFETALADASPDRDFGERSGDDLYILYTGGTTGMPKGVMWRQEDVFMALGQGINSSTGHQVSHDRELAELAAAGGGPVVLLNTPPLMHGAAQWGTLGQLAQGNVVILMPKFDAEEVWNTVEREGANSIMIAGDAMGRPMIEALEADPERWDLSSLFAITSSAALFSVPVKERYFERMPQLMIIDSIGSSEGGFNGLSAVGKDNPTGGSSGGLPRVSPGQDVIVVDDDLNPLRPGDGNVGKVARTGNIPLGYYKDEEKTARTFLTGADGKRYVVAGDFARWEDDGTVTLLGRGSVCINSGGEKIFPEEVEGVYKASPDVRDVLVVGVPDDRWGNAVTAVVEAVPGHTLDLDVLNEAARSKLASYKLPRHLVVVDEIVRSPAGKPDYPWAAKHAAEVISSRQ